MWLAVSPFLAHEFQWVHLVWGVRLFAPDLRVHKCNLPCVWESSLFSGVGAGAHFSIVAGMGDYSVHLANALGCIRPLYANRLGDAAVQSIAQAGSHFVFCRRGQIVAVLSKN